MKVARKISMFKISFKSVMHIRYVDCNAIPHNYALTGFN